MKLHVELLRFTPRRIRSLTFADGREVPAMPNKVWHVCGRPRDGERAVSCEPSVWVRPLCLARTKLADFFSILLGNRYVWN
jgi:hypothetical protein